MKTTKQRVKEYRERKKQAQQNSRNDLELLRQSLLKLEVHISNSLLSCEFNDCNLNGAKSVLADAQKLAQRIEI